MKSSKLITQSECFTSYGKNIHFNGMRVYNNRAIRFYFIGTTSYYIAYKCDDLNNVRYDLATLENYDGFIAHGNGEKKLYTISFNAQNFLNADLEIIAMITMIV